MIVNSEETRKEEEGDCGESLESLALTTHGGRREDSVPDKRQAQTALHSIPASGSRHYTQPVSVRV